MSDQIRILDGDSGQIGLLEGEIEVLQQQVVHAESTIKGLKTELEAARDVAAMGSPGVEMKEAIRQQTAPLKQRVSDLEVELQAKQREVAEATSRAQEALDGAQNARIKAVEREASAEARAEMAIAEADANRDRLQFELGEARSDTQRLHQEAAHLRSELHSAEMQKTSTAGAIAQLRAEVERIRAREADLEARAMQNSQSESDAATLHQQQQQQRHMDQMSSQLSNMDLGLRRLTERCAAASQIRVELARDGNTLQKQCGHVNGELNALQEVSQHLQDLQSTMINQMQGLSDVSDTRDTSLEAERARSHTAHLEQVTVTLLDKGDTAEVELAQAKRELADTQQERDGFKVELHHRDTKIQALQQALVAMEQRGGSALREVELISLLKAPLPSLTVASCPHNVDGL